MQWRTLVVVVIDDSILVEGWARLSLLLGGDE